jgi:hypothetical protein
VISWRDRFLVTILFAAAAGWRLAIGQPVPPQPLPAPVSVTLPAAPPGWQRMEERPLANPGAPGRAATYRAPDGSALLLERRVACPQRGEIPPSFGPDDALYLKPGWIFDEKGGSEALLPGITARRLKLRHAQETTLDLFAYASGGRVVPGYEDFEGALIRQRVRRTRPLWTKARAVARPGSEAAHGADALLWEALQSGS